VVSGICGRTGSLVAAELASADGVELVGGVEARGHAAVGKSVVEVCGAGSADGRVVAELGELAAGFDVLVDFSAPEQAVRCAEFAASAGVGLVVATTGLTDDQVASVREAASSVAVVLASNTSVGANVLFALLGTAGAVLGDDYDIEIVEAHHRGKRDAPSGTALTAAGILAEARGARSEEVVLAGRSGRDSARKDGEIGVHSVRGGAVAGRHTVQFLSELETLSVEHVALSRRAFAVGAVRAARFAAESGPGLYDMRDVLGLND
jgi:4-hydroxy-tetrahydrodipicolinate reductase